MANFLDALNTVIWSPVLVFLCLGAGIYFTVVTRGLQVRCIPDMLKQIVNGEKSADGVSSFQSLMVSLSGRVGVGNIAGVATAISFGGPGAVFWMWAVALLGSSTSFIECTLAQIYKEKDQDTGEYRGGPAYYIEKAYKHTKAAPFMMVYGILFAIAMILATSYFLPGIQDFENKAQWMQVDLAARTGVQFLDMKPSTRNNGMCADANQRMWAGLVDFTGGDGNLPIHMNQRGHEHTANVIARS